MIEGERAQSRSRKLEKCLSTVRERSITGTIVGGMLLGLVSAAVLIPLLVLLLLLSAVKVWRH